MTDVPARIVLICPFFGKLPYWVPAFLESCRHNQGIDWLIFTDDKPPQCLPGNVTFRQMPLSKFSALCSDTLGLNIEISPAFTYKLCDFKPAFGKICEDYISGYDFWGHCDMDIIWGDMASFLPGAHLRKFDMITSGRGRVWGHLTLFRNNGPLKSLYSNIPGFEAAALDPTSLHRVDEKLITRFLKARQPRLPGKLWWLTEYLQTGTPKVYWHWKERIVSDGPMQKAAADGGGSFLWKGGKTYAPDGKELMYVHFHKLKQTMAAGNFAWIDDPAEIELDARGIKATFAGAGSLALHG